MGEFLDAEIESGLSHNRDDANGGALDEHDGALDRHGNHEHEDAFNQLLLFFYSIHHMSKEKT
ncbi:hypothetical protein [Lederbergia citrea]|uniref:Uncharacterized protein n=1 Tax=Lederbergia citrea TaxID=2833581 RepID=A0A942Z356_9BACI|nr:hypothetical protein [Lederbergia citrea]MBS4204213.1 hypothetical protein [Lederbergia citrea]MBS4221202.1 hypothetical protein [Lederbergia citrea]